MAQPLKIGVRDYIENKFAGYSNKSIYRIVNYLLLIHERALRGCRVILPVGIKN